MLLCAVGAVDLASPAGQTGLVGRVQWVSMGPVRLWLKLFSQACSLVTHSGVLCEEIAPKEHHIELLSHRTGVFHQPCCLDIKIHNEIARLEICTRHAV